MLNFFIMKKKLNVICVFCSFFYFDFVCSICIENKSQLQTHTHHRKDDAFFFFVLTNRIRSSLASVCCVRVCVWQQFFLDELDEPDHKLQYERDKLTADKRCKEYITYLYEMRSKSRWIRSLQNFEPFNMNFNFIPYHFSLFNRKITWISFTCLKKSIEIFYFRKSMKLWNNKWKFSKILKTAACILNMESECHWTHSFVSAYTHRIPRTSHTHRAFTLFSLTNSLWRHKHSHFSWQTNNECTTTEAPIEWKLKHEKYMKKSGIYLQFFSFVLSLHWKKFQLFIYFFIKN